jgi:hypothetical protein
MLQFVCEFIMDILLGTYKYLNLVTHKDMWSQHPSTAKIDDFELSLILNFRRLLHL